MNKETGASALARAGVVVVGLVAVVCGIYLLNPLFGFLGVWLEGMSTGGDGLGIGNLVVLLGALLGPALLLVTGVLLLKNADAISLKYFSHTVVRTEIVIYRVIFASIGIFLVAKAFTQLGTLVVNLASKYFSNSPIEMGSS